MSLCRAASALNDLLSTKGDGGLADLPAPSIHTAASCGRDLRCFRNIWKDLPWLVTRFHQALFIFSFFPLYYYFFVQRLTKFFSSFMESARGLEIVVLGFYFVSVLGFAGWVWGLGVKST